MLIIKTQKQKRFFKDQARPEVYVTKILRDDLTDEIIFTFRFDLPVKTKEIAKSGVKRIKIIVNEVTIKRSKTDFEQYKNTKTLPVSKRLEANYNSNGSPKRVEIISQKNISSMDEIRTNIYSPTNNKMTGVKKVIESVPLPTLVAEMLTSHARQAVAQDDRTKTFNTKMTFNPANFHSVKNSSNKPVKAEDLSTEVVVDFILMDDVIHNFLEIKRAGGSLDKVYNNRSSKIVGQTRANNRRSQKIVKKQNTIDGAMTGRIGKWLSMLTTDPDLNQIEQMFPPTTSSRAKLGYGIVAKSGINKGISPTDLIDMSVDDIITAKMLFAGTGIIDD